MTRLGSDITMFRENAARRIAGLTLVSMLVLASCGPSSRAFAQEELSSLVRDLSDARYQVRQAAALQLSQMPPTRETVAYLEKSLETQSDPECARRILSVLETQFRDVDYQSETATYLSESIERSLVSPRWYLSEAARDVVDRQWQKRVEIAVAELVRLGVPVRPTDPSLLWKIEDVTEPARRRDPTRDQHLKVFVDETWPQNDRAFELLKRLEPLVSDSFLSGTAMVSIYQIDGNPLSIEQIATLKGIFGENRVQQRGRVCLGITQEPLFGDENGVLISAVEKNSSADLAGLQSDDVIVALNGKPTRDFEELVTLLRQYKVGDEVEMSVFRQGRTRASRAFRIEIPPIPDEEKDEERADPSLPEKVKVTLKGWY